MSGRPFWIQHAAPPGAPPDFGAEYAEPAPGVQCPRCGRDLPALIGAQVAGAPLFERAFEGAPGAARWTLYLPEGHEARQCQAPGGA